MTSELIIAVIAGCGGLLGWGFADFFAKMTIGEIGDVASLVWAHIAGTLILFVVAFVLFVQGSLAVPHTFIMWLLLAFFGALQAAVYLFVYKGFAKGPVAVLNPIFASFTGLVAICSVIFFHEVLNMYLLPILILVFAGVMLLSLDPAALKARRFSLKTPGVPEVALATGLATIWTLFWNVFVSGADWVAYALCMYVFMTITMYLVAYFQNVDLTAVRNKPFVWKYLAAIGVCEVVAYLAISYGYSATSLTSIVAVISGAFSIPVIVCARIFLKERPTTLQTIGSILVIVGVVCLPLV